MNMCLRSLPTSSRAHNSIHSRVHDATATDGKHHFLDCFQLHRVLWIASSSLCNCVRLILLNTLLILTVQEKIPILPLWLLSLLLPNLQYRWADQYMSDVSWLITLFGGYFLGCFRGKTIKNIHCQSNHYLTSLRMSFSTHCLLNIPNRSLMR